MNTGLIYAACVALGLEEPISIEQDGTVWLGLDDDRTYPDMAPILEKAKEIQAQEVSKKVVALEKLAVLGLTEDDIKTIING